MVSNDDRPSAGRLPMAGLAAITLAASVLVATPLVTSTAFAQPSERELIPPRRPPIPLPSRWSAALGGGALYAPIFPGSKSFIVTPAPMPDISYRAELPGLDTIYLNGRDGLGVVVLREGPFSAGAAVGYAVGRWANWSPRTLGLEDIKPAVRASLFLRANVGPIGVSLQADKPFGNQNGTLVTLEGSYRYKLTPALTVVGLVGATWADSKYMQQWFGVDQQGASNTQYPVYQPGSGMRSVSTSLSGAFSLSKSWMVNASVGVSLLVGNAAASPIIETTTVPFGLLGLSYRF